VLVNAEVKFIARVKCTARAELVAPMKRLVDLFTATILMNAQCGRMPVRSPFGYVSLMNVLDDLSFVTTKHGKRILETRESLSTRTLSNPLPS
jgi:hypothetical protein